MKERGILMHARSVQNILAGRKTQTRRIIKPQPDGMVNNLPFWEGLGVKFTPGGMPTGYATPRCPYGQPGDRLWVRERWRVVGWHEGEPIVIEYADGKREEESGSDAPGYEDWYERMIIQSGEDCEKAGIELDPITEVYTFPESGPVTRWRPSIHMPRWASRITLEITDIRVERVQEITDADIRAEGVEVRGGTVTNRVPGVGKPTLRDAWAALWEDTNGKGAWERNEFVWIIDFKVVTP